MLQDNRLRKTILMIMITPLHCKNKAAILNPIDSDDFVLHYERTRRIMSAKALLDMFKSDVLNTIMLMKKLFQYNSITNKRYEDGPIIF